MKQTIGPWPVSLWQNTVSASEANVPHSYTPSNKQVLTGTVLWKQVYKLQAQKCPRERLTALFWTELIWPPPQCLCSHTLFLQGWWGLVTAKTLILCYFILTFTAEFLSKTLNCKSVMEREKSTTESSANEVVEEVVRFLLKCKYHYSNKKILLNKWESYLKRRADVLTWIKNIRLWLTYNHITYHIIRSLQWAIHASVGEQHFTVAHSEASLSYFMSYTAH